MTINRRSWLGLRWELNSLFAMVIVLWTLTSLAKVMFNGLNLGLDYGLYHPDGAFYTFRALLFAGYDKFEAGRIVADWYATHPTKPSVINPTSLFFENAPTTWDQYYPRVLYPPPLGDVCEISWCTRDARRTSSNLSDSSPHHSIPGTQIGASRSRTVCNSPRYLFNDHFQMDVHKRH